MKIFLWILNYIRIFFRFLSKNFSLFIAIAALYVAIESMNNANRQFQINSETSDSIFNIQLKNSKELNDSLINQISILQDITNKQLQTTDKQLKISIELLQDQIYSGRPKMVVLSNKIADTIKTLDYIFSPRIVTIYKNNGKRFANNLTIRKFIISNNLSEIETNIQRKKSILVESNAIRETQSIPKINKKFRDNFYYCYEFIYYDKILNKEFTQPYYFQYYKIGGKYNFYNCEIEDEVKIKETINNWLRPKNERLFDQ